MLTESPPLGTPPTALGASYISTATLASFVTHIPPPFETSNSIALSNPYLDHKLSSRLQCRAKFTTVQFISFSVLLIVVAIQFLRPPIFSGDQPSPIGEKRPPQTPFFGLGDTCDVVSPFSEHLAISRPGRMSLKQAAQKVAAEFDFSTKDLNNAVQEFMKELGETDRYGTCG